MKRIAFVIVATLLALPAVAQEPPFAPITIDENTFKGINGYLVNLPWKEAQPLILMFDQKEREAASAVAKMKADADKAKSDDTKSSK